MVKKLIIIFVAVAAAVGIYFIFFRETEEQKIRRMLNNLCIDCAKSKESSSAVSLIVKTDTLKNYFADPCSLSVYKGFMQGNFSDVRAANEIMRANLFFKSSDLSYYDLHITVDGDEASVGFSGRFQAVLKSGERIDEVRDVSLQLCKIDNKWKIKSAEVQKILQRK